MLESSPDAPGIQGMRTLLLHLRSIRLSGELTYVPLQSYPGLTQFVAVQKDLGRRRQEEAEDSYRREEQRTRDTHQGYFMCILA